MQWTLPFGAPSAANWIGMMAQRHFHEFGTTREQLAQIALNARRNAALNPKAIYRDPMTLDDYLIVRMVSTPLCLYDCDVPADGSTAVIVSPRRRRAATCASRRCTSRRSAPRSTAARRGTSSTTSPRWRCATPRAMMWTRTDLTPGRRRRGRAVRRLQLHHPVLARGARLLRQGRGRPVPRGRRATSPATASIPLNTHGGQLSAGRLHGYGFLHEACVQLRGEGGERQVVRPGGRRPEVAVAGAGGGPLAACLLLTRG